MSVANPTRLRKILNLMLDKYGEISIANGFLSDVDRVDGSYLDYRDMMKFPVISVYFGEVRISSNKDDHNSVRTSGDYYANVYAVGIISGTSSKTATRVEMSQRQEKVLNLMNDLFAKTMEMATAYVNDSNYAFVIDVLNRPPKVYPVPDFLNQQDAVPVICEFVIKIHNITHATQA